MASKKLLSNERELITNCGLKVTRARVKVLETFKTSGTPMSVLETVERMPKGLADQATVYRIIQSFVEKGLLKEVNLRHGHVDYEMTEPGDHHHLVCVKCGVVADFSGCEAEKLAARVLKRCPSFKRINEHAFEFFGVCKTCAA